MSGEAFTRRWLGLFALLAGLTVLAPFLIEVLIRNSGCGEVSGACASLGDTMDYHGRWIVLAITLSPLIVAIAGRTLTMGVFVWAFPFALLMIGGAMPLLSGLADFREPDFLDRLMELPALIPLLLLVVLLLALSIGSDEQEGASGAWKLVLGFAALAAAFITARAWLIGIEQIPYAANLAPPMAYYIAVAHAALGITEALPQLTNTVLVAFILAAAGVMFSARRGGGGHRSAYA